MGKSFEICGISNFRGNPVTLILYGMLLLLIPSSCISGGHSNNSMAPLSSGYYMESDGNQWKELTSMIEARKDHACLYIELEDTNGILVTGGLGENSVSNKIYILLLNCFTEIYNIQYMFTLSFIL